MVFTPRPATELTVAPSFNAVTDQLLLVRNGQVFKLGQLPVGPQGDPGADGADGAAGPSVELQTSGGFLQYRVVGSDTWINLVAIEDISGSSITAAPGVPDNGDGREGDLYIDTNDGELYFRGPINWFSIGNITGPPGPTGATGAQGPQGEQGDPGSGGGLGFWPYYGGGYDADAAANDSGTYLVSSEDVFINDLKDSSVFDFTIIGTIGQLVISYNDTDYTFGGINFGLSTESISFETDDAVPPSGWAFSNNQSSDFGWMRIKKEASSALEIVTSYTDWTASFGI